MTIDIDYSHLHNIAKTDLLIYYSFKSDHPSKEDHHGVISGLEAKWHITKPAINRAYEHDREAKKA